MTSVLLVALVCVATRAAAAGSPSAPALGRQPAAPRTLVVPLIENMPRIDGRLDDEVWTRAAAADHFIQREPRAGEPAVEQTEVRVYYTRAYLLIGARLRDSDPARIVASEYLRDADLESNDSFEVYLDTFHDRRNAFFFSTNAVGAQRDGLVRDEGEALNWEWDGVWHVASARDDQGWTTEIAIPLSTLRFRPDAGDGWGVNFGRLVARTREQSFWAPISRDWGFFGKYRVSGFGHLTGIANVGPGGRVQLKPFALGGGDQDFVDRRGDRGPIGELGLDAKVALGPTIVADLTLNTDFAQVESDQQQVNLTRFPLFFPEKREFFLENAGLFQIGERIRHPEPPSTLLFFSRRIGITEKGDPVPLLGGARVTGKLGPYDIGALDIVANEARAGDGTRTPRTNFAALRVKRDILARSSIGAMFLSKSPAGRASSNQVVAADAAFKLPKNASVGGFAARSFTPGLKGSSHAVGVDLGWERDRAGLFGSYVDIDEDFNAEMGFLSRTGIRQYRVAAGLARRPRALGLRHFFMGNDHVYITDRKGRLQSQTNRLGPAAVWNNGSFMFAGWLNVAEELSAPFEIREHVWIPAGTYRFNQALLFFDSDRSRAISGRAIVVSGGFFDGSLNSVTLAGRVRPHPRLTLDLDYIRNDVSLPVANGEFSTQLVITRAAFAFSTRAFLRGLVQINDDDREARANVLFRYTYRPGSDLFVVYNEDRGIRGARPAVKRRQLLVKLTIHVAPF